ncbi:hypothetical protein ABIE89_005992 [Bradyrhizobium niftali]
MTFHGQKPGERSSVWRMRPTSWPLHGVIVEADPAKGEPHVDEVYLLGPHALSLAACLAIRSSSERVCLTLRRRSPMARSLLPENEFKTANGKFSSPRRPSQRRPRPRSVILRAEPPIQLRNNTSTFGNEQNCSVNGASIAVLGPKCPSNLQRPRPPHPKSPHGRGRRCPCFSRRAAPCPSDVRPDFGAAPAAGGADATLLYRGQPQIHPAIDQQFRPAAAIDQDAAQALSRISPKMILSGRPSACVGVWRLGRSIQPSKRGAGESQIIDTVGSKRSRVPARRGCGSLIAQKASTGSG